jgi:FeS assembly SUF system protein
VEPSAYVLEDEGLLAQEALALGTSLDDVVVASLRTIHDPEIPLNIYDLGLVYRVQIGNDRSVEIDMTLTSPACPVAGVLVRQVHDAVRRIPSVARVRTELVWDPPWSKARMSEAAQFALGLL